MERTCEFCAALRPIIYCTPDAAHLCLSCDAKVHSANALSSRHLRTLLCESCRSFPTYLQCLDHQMFLCRGCDRTLHVSSSQHQKRTIRGYMGCPSANDFAALWGFHVNEVDKDKFVSTCGSETSSVVKAFDAPGRSHSHITAARMSYPPHVSITEAENKVLYKAQEKGSSFILQQILELNRLQLVKKNGHSPLILGEGKDSATSLRPCTLEKFEQSLNQHVHHSEDFGTDLQQRDSLLQELKMTSFTQLENFPLSSPILLPFHGESLWHCKSPAESSQLWSQNMQDLGVCDELVCRDDFNIPEVDLTFQNFDEIFNSDQDPTGGLFDNKDESYSSIEKDMSLSKSDNHNGKGMEASSATWSSCIFSYALMDKDSEPSGEVCNLPMSTSMESARPIRPSLSTLSFADSRMSVDSAGTDCPDYWARGEPSCSSPYHREHKHSIPLDHGDTATRMYKEKKQSQQQDKQIRLKARSLVKKRVRGRYEKAERYDSSTIAISRSY
ncbi:putative zinc finger protein At1g68190 [Benincasa hispida]|uniref:putative zinc finger protein At1g68190 n=1 Tax=Benincasa hispida TaxID=102211 RepID=UPI001900D676|nr:putative zinc finger protein At1g68190 [Benincasa hispida]XP_038892502.1 putative zinc finger protein At1g68190 [Benincasa hispida]XP_038892503.1 putative zinc finger protein At1g68190 [Benincasa hispida]XP_038892504.1 putative zinc finger protein At1g68190 [Benincasa hispida]